MAAPADCNELWQWLQGRHGPKDEFILELDEQVKTNKGQTAQEDNKYKPS